MPAILDEYLDLELHYGARIRVMTTLDRSDKYRNPGVSTLTEYLDREGYGRDGIRKESAPGRTSRRPRCLSALSLVI